MDSNEAACEKSMIDTITAIATPPGRGGVGIVRISGSQAFSIAQTICHFSNTKTPDVARAVFYDAQRSIIDDGLVLFFKNPRSFTGEDVAELQAHGSPMVLDQLIARAIDLGARLARPGEFTERAFLNHKIDLTQAEAIADLISASSIQAARAATRSLQGEFSKKIEVLQEMLTTLRMHVEAAIDFPEEEIDFLADPKIETSLKEIIYQVEQIKNTVKQGVLLQSGINVVIAGKPNVGKSSLLNYLSGKSSAIVTDIPGTTRDILRESIQIDGLPLHIIDTAGLRETKDIVEQEGVRRTKAQLSQADVVLWMRDINDDVFTLDQLGLNAEIKPPVILITNKIDLTNKSPAVIAHPDFTEVCISVTKSLGLDLLKKKIHQFAGFHSEEQDIFIARRRHVDTILRAHQQLIQAQQHLRQGELLAEGLRQAQLVLSEITGELTSDDLLGKIFSEFCIGK
ncbi:MAG: tRNA uridine-5-carboxymethylaminomethyl(34) synthesis GTPase MnmE [Gammaproteobacteria bacterium RIFCSPHIGHO2_12_FULL_42_13]|nr:MAG: tRNA uridine-5-carboxymethylaminomethyl(34) synthesis GTPase MnmE [Gammaproteobacteria bacterium RIFCSPHIGHO2_12_FULL_42_13]